MPREGGRRAKRAQRDTAATGVPQLPFRARENPHPPLEPLSRDQLHAIHDSSLRILEEDGIEVMGEEPLRVLAEAGCIVDRASGMVRMDIGLVNETLKSCPPSFTLTPRNPHHAISIGGRALHFGLVSGPPNVQDNLTGRRSGNFADYLTLIKFAQVFNVIGFLGNQAVAPIELPANSRHMDTSRANLIYTDKVFNHQLIGAGRARDSVVLVARALDMSLEELAARPACIGNININSPRKLDEAMATGAMEMARLGQAVIVTPFTLLGAMTPVTMAAGLVQQNAEALFGICLTQFVRPGAPVVYGGFTSNVDMRSGAPAFGTPENAKANLAGGQLARFYRLPYRSSACNAANCVDAQSTYETLMAMWGAVMGHGNLIYHAAGWLEGGLSASFEKVMLDVEMIQHVLEMIAPIDTDNLEAGLEAIREVAPGGHFFGSAHTMERYDTAFYAPLLSDWRNFETWQEDGARTATARATDLWQQMLEQYEQPPLDAARIEAMDAYIRERKQAIGGGEP